MQDDLAGERIDNYDVIELMARSGMASIFKARDIESGTTVVLKVPHLQLESDIVFFERFKREQEIGQRLDHPSIVKVVTPKNPSRTYIVLEYVDGKSLRKVMDDEKPMQATKALALAIQLAGALAYMHERGVVHRDLKPENIVITPEGQVKILDFGIALDEAARRITWYGLSSTVGTPDYMAPEQIGGRRGDERTDIYALGTILFEMVTGHLPFVEDSAQAMMRAKTSESPKSPSYFVPDIDPRLETIILQALQPKPRERYRHANEMLADLKNPAAVAVRVFDASSGSATRSRQLLVGLIIVAVLCGVGLLAFVTGRRAPASQPPAASQRAK